MAVCFPFDDEANQEELQILWGDRLTALTPMQRQMVVEILRQTKRYSKSQHNRSQSSCIASNRADLYTYSCC